MSKKGKEIILSLVIGFVIGSVIIAIALFFGFRYAYSHHAASYQVKMLGLTIYQLTRANKGGYSTLAIQANMGIVCALCMVLSVSVFLVFSHFKRK